MGGEPIAKKNKIDSQLRGIFLAQMKAVSTLDEDMGYPSWCGTCNDIHQMERFQAAINAVEKLRDRFVHKMGMN